MAAETSPASVRGLLISVKEAAIVGGILLGYSLSYLFSDDVGGWRSMYEIVPALALVLGLGMVGDCSPKSTLAGVPAVTPDVAAAVHLIHAAVGGCQRGPTRWHLLCLFGRGGGLLHEYFIIGSLSALCNH